MAVFDAGTIEAILRLRDEFTGVAKRVATQAKTLGDRIDRSGAAMGRAGSALAPLSLGVAALGVGALKAAIDFELSFAGVIKTVDDATDSMGRLTPVGEELKQSFRDLALEIPVSANELAGIGEVAGQLGIETQNIAGFTETMAKLGVTTNLSAEEAATSLARLANVTGLPQTEFERLGSTVVALGNNLATTESEIVMFGQRIAGAGAIAGLSEPQILAIGGAMSSVGIEAEAGGTAVQKALLTMNDAVAGGGAELARFADLSGQSVEQFAAGWRDNAGAQFTAFVEGLAAQGDQASAVLKELIGTDQRLQRAFLSLAESGDTLRNAMSLANVAWVENTALAKEAEIRFQTTSAELTILWNNVKDVAISLGEALLPVLHDAVGFLQESVVPALRDAAEWFTNLSPASKRLAAGFAALIVVATPVLFTLSTMAPLLSAIAGGFAALVPSAAAAGAATVASGTAAAAARVQFEALFATQTRVAIGARAAWVSMLGGKATAVLATLKAALLAVTGVFASLLTPVGAVVAVVGLLVAAFAALLVGTKEGRAALAATGRVIKEGLVWAFNLLRNALEGAWEWTKTFAAGLIDMIPPAVLDSLDWVAKAIGGMADAIGRTNAAAAATDHLARLNQEMLDLGTSTGLTKEAMDRIARQAIELRDKGQTLTVGLARIVDHFQKTTLASEQLQATLEAVRGTTSIADLSNMTMRLAESGQSSSDVMKVIAERARALQTDGSDLTTVLQNVVNAYGEAATAGEAFGENTGGATPPVKALAKDVQALIDTWTGADLKSEALVAAFETLTAEQLANDRVMAQMIGSYDSMREILGPFHEELEQLWQTHERLKTPLESNTDLTDRFMEAQIAATQAQAALNERLDAHRRALLGLPTDEAITAFEELNLAWADIIEQGPVSEETMNRYAATLRDAAAAGHELTAEEVALVEATAEAVKTHTQYEVALASLAGQLGGAAGQSLNLAIAMMEHNKQQDEAIRLGKESAEQFSTIRINAAKASAVFHTLGDAIDGTAGKILSEVGNIAQAFASGGLVGGIIAGVGAAIKGLKSLFGVSEAEKKARAFADTYADTIIKTLNDAQLAEAVDAALGAWRGNERGAQFLIGVRDGFVAAGRSAAEAEQLVGRYWKAVRDGSPDAVKAIEAQIDAVVKVGQAVQELQAFDSARDQLQQLTSAAEFFGVEAEEMGERLGNAFQAVEQAATAEDIAQHFHTLLASGVDLGTALDLAKDKVQGVITASVQMGTEIPASMQPIAEQLIAQGQLLDASGKKITDINQLEFGTSMTEGLQILVLSMNQLVETMGGEIPAAARRFAQGVGDGARQAEQALREDVLAQIEHIGLAVHDLSVKDLATMAATFESTAQAAGLSLDGVLGEQLDALKTGLGSMSRDELPQLVRSFQQTATDAVQAFDRIPRTLTFEHHTRYSSSGSPGATTRSGFQSGTAGRFVDFGVGTAVVLHGRERVVTEAEGRREASDLGALRQELADLKRIMERGQDELPFRMSRAIRDAMAETV